MVHLGSHLGLRFEMERDVETYTTFHQAIEIARRLERIRMKEKEDKEAKSPSGTGRFSGAYFGGRGHNNRGYSSSPVIPHFTFPVVLQLAMGFRVLVQCVFHTWFSHCIFRSGFLQWLFP